MTKKYDLVIDLKTDTVHTRIIKLVGERKNVLEFGCATGYMSRVLTQQCQCTVTGVEINAEAASEAEKVCKRVILGDAEKIDFETELVMSNLMS